MNAATLQRDSDSHPTIRHSQSGRAAQDVAYHGPENALLNVAQGSPVMRATPPGLDQGQGGSGRSSCSDSPMSLGSLALGSSLALALKVCTWPVTPSTFSGQEELPRSTVEEEEEEMDAAESDDADQAKD